MRGCSPVRAGDFEDLPNDNEVSQEISFCTRLRMSRFRSVQVDRQARMLAASVAAVTQLRSAKKMVKTCTAMLTSKASRSHEHDQTGCTSLTGRGHQSQQTNAQVKHPVRQSWYPCSIHSRQPSQSMEPH